MVRCGECHLFHTYGVVPLQDFPSPAPQFPPNRKPRLALSLYVPHLRSAGDPGSPLISLRRTQLAPWWIGIVASVVLAGATMGWVRLLPRQEAAQEVVAGVAPQPAREVPAIDDTYQTNIPHLYIIGEAAGTASINLAMRTGRQVIEAITNELHATNPLKRADVYDVVIVGCGPAGLGLPQRRKPRDSITRRSKK